MHKAFADNKTVMGLDRFGYPAAPLANDILAGMDGYGDNTKQLEKSWYEWLSFYPFDAKVAKRLAELYRKRLESLDPQKDAAQRQRLKNKLELIRNRSRHYDPAQMKG